MPAIRQSGQGGRQQFVWQGATVQQAWLEQIKAGMEAEATEIEADLRSSIHVVSGDMHDKAFARVEVAGTKRQLVLGSESDHAIYEELRHPEMTAVFDRHVGHVTEKIQAARAG